MHAIGLTFEPVEETLDTIPGVFPGFAITLHHPLLMRRFEFFERNVHGNLGRLGRAFHIALTDHAFLGLKDFDHTAFDGFALIGNSEAVVNTNDASESTTCFAGTHG